MIKTLIVLAKQPLPGRVKTRLTPPLTPRQAARLAAAALADTLDAVTETQCEHRLLAFDGCVDDWLRPGWTHCEQPRGGLDRRLVRAFDAAGAGSALLVGMDTPQLGQSTSRFDPSRWDACLGPALDGGYWAIGFREATDAAAAIAGIPMSTEYTAHHQLERMRGLGMRVQLLEQLVDVDTIADAEVVADLVPSSAFGVAFAHMNPARTRALVR